jgi:hypothetical protein
MAVPLKFAAPSWLYTALFLVDDKFEMLREKPLCRACGATLTKNLRRQRFLDTHAHDYTGPLVPDDAYWIVAQPSCVVSIDGVTENSCSQHTLSAA